MSKAWKRRLGWYGRMCVSVAQGTGTILSERGKPHVWAHCQAVAAEAARLAARFSLDVDVCEAAGFCHDLGCALPPSEMVAEAQRLGWSLDPAEEKYPFLLHQRFSALYSREWLHITDERLLSAVGCHTTLRAEATGCDMVVFLADKLAWDQPGDPPSEKEVRAALEVSLPNACRVYMDYVMKNGMILMPHQWFIDARAWLENQ